jgi:hypothetical protein
LKGSLLGCKVKRLEEGSEGNRVGVGLRGADRGEARFKRRIEEGGLVVGSG